MRDRAKIQEDYRLGHYKDVSGHGDHSRSLIEIEVALDIRELLVELNKRVEWEFRGDPPDGVPVRTERDSCL